ncbi:MAG: serine protease [Polyangiaceae bacterium]
MLKREGKEWVANLERADPDGDRCVLGVRDGNFKPVSGVRSFASLEVGETVYTLGSPSGFDLSLASGVLSGRREENARKYVQTTAPISPGSSGGGLFDARGNLIGITTLVVVGRDRINQSLNFAIPAESFWQP